MPSDRSFPLHPHEVTGLYDGSVTLIVRPIPFIRKDGPWWICETKHGYGPPFDVCSVFQTNMEDDMIEHLSYVPAPLHPSDTLVGKETWAAPEEYDDWLPSDIHAKGYWYKADGHAPAAFVNGQRGKWRSPLHQMPWASRIRVPVMSVKAKRVSEMSTEEIIRWGIKLPPCCGHKHECESGDGFGIGSFRDDLSNAAGGRPWQECMCADDALKATWRNLYGTRYPWATSWAWLYKVGRNA